MVLVMPLGLNIGEAKIQKQVLRILKIAVLAANVNLKGKMSQRVVMLLKMEGLREFTLYLFAINVTIKIIMRFMRSKIGF
jgi:hypothetical protein